METKELLDFLGIEAEDMEKFKTEFQGKYHTESQIHADKKLLGKYTGKTLRTIKSAILNNAREFEIPFTQNEFDDVEVEEVVKTLKQRQAEMYKSQINDLQGQIGKSGEEAIKPWQEKVSKFELSLADEKKAKKEIADQFERFKTESEGKIKQTRVDYFKKDLLTSIDYDPIQIKDELKKKGWESHVADNFKFDFDETDNPIILDKTGSKIKNPKKADEWLSPKEVLTMEAEKLNLLKKNQQGGQPAFRQAPMPQNGQPPQLGTPPITNPTKANRLAPGMEQYLTK